MAEKTIRELQATIPWNGKYSEDFDNNPQPHKHFTHALVHVVKAAGKLLALADELDHGASPEGHHETHGKFVADLQYCTFRAANEFPGGPLDLQAAFEARVFEKNAPAAACGAPPSAAAWTPMPMGPGAIADAGGGITLGTTRDSERKPADPTRPWVAIVQWGAWQCTSRHGAELAARHAAQSFAAFARDAAAAPMLREEIAAWKSATGLVRGGCPEAVTPAMLEGYIHNLERVARVAQKLLGVAPAGPRADAVRLALDALPPEV